MKIIQIQTHVVMRDTGQEKILYALSESGRVFEWKTYPGIWVPLPLLPSDEATLDERLKRDAG